MAAAWPHGGWKAELDGSHVVGRRMIRSALHFEAGRTLPWLLVRQRIREPGKV